MALSAVSAAGAKMIRFSRTLLPGYHQPELHKSMGQQQTGPWEQELEQLTKKHGCGLTIGWAERDGDTIYNSASCFDENGQKAAHFRNSSSSARLKNQPLHL